MKNFYPLLIIINLFILACTKQNEPTQPFEPISMTQINGVSLSNDGYLIFKDQNSYLEISEKIDRMTDDEFLLWEKSIGFYSAQTLLSIVNEKIENLKSIEEYEDLKQEYSEKFIFEEDGSVRLPFYATAWNRVLTIDGVMKIGDKLYKFDKEKEIIVNNGEKKDLENITLLEKDTSRVYIFYPNQEINKSSNKSLAWGSLMSNMVKTGNKIGDSRLSYSLQLISFNYKGYGVTNPPVYYTEAGFQFKLDLYQERKGLFGWFLNETMYYFSDGTYHIEYNEPERWVNVYVNDVFIGRKKYGGNHVIEIKSFPDDTYGETKHGCSYTFYKYYFVDEYSWSFVEPQIFNFELSFYSRGIGSENKVTLTYSNI
jgi:hypothetical protein